MKTLRFVLLNNGAQMASNSETAEILTRKGTKVYPRNYL